MHSLGLLVFCLTIRNGYYYELFCFCFDSGAFVAFIAYDGAVLLFLFVIASCCCLLLFLLVLLFLFLMMMMMMMMTPVKYYI